MEIQVCIRYEAVVRNGLVDWWIDGWTGQHSFPQCIGMFTRQYDDNDWHDCCLLTLVFSEIPLYARLLGVCNDSWEVWCSYLWLAARRNTAEMSSLQPQQSPCVEPFVGIVTYRVIAIADICTISWWHRPGQKSFQSFEDVLFLACASI